MEGKTVANVIKGYMSRYEIEELTLIDDSKDNVIYSGDVNKFMKATGMMKTTADIIKIQCVKRVLNFNDRKLFVFY